MCRTSSCLACHVACSTHQPLGLHALPCWLVYLRGPAPGGFQSPLMIKPSAKRDCACQHVGASSLTCRYSDPNDDSLMASPLEHLHRHQHMQGCGPLPPPPPLTPEQQQQQQQQQQQEQPQPLQPQGQPAGQASLDSGPSVATGPAVHGSGPLLGLRMQFLLPSSTYATMLIRWGFANASQIQQGRRGSHLTS